MEIFGWLDFPTLVRSNFIGDIIYVYSIYINTPFLIVCRAELAWCAWNFCFVVWIKRLFMCEAQMVSLKSRVCVRDSFRRRTTIFVVVFSRLREHALTERSVFLSWLFSSTYYATLVAELSVVLWRETQSREKRSFVSGRSELSGLINLV